VIFTRDETKWLEARETGAGADPTTAGRGPA
jgi:hypothetical protein